MDQIADIVEASARSRRGDARARAWAARRAIRPSDAERYQTPVWLEHSFVLPVGDSPRQAAHRDGIAPSEQRSDEVPAQPDPVHEEVTAPAAPTLETRPSASPVLTLSSYGFVRPECPPIDFAEVVRRTDALRRARAVALLAFCLTLVATAIFVVTRAGELLPLAVVVGCVGCAALLRVDSVRRAGLPVVRS